MAPDSLHPSKERVVDDAPITPYNEKATYLNGAMQEIGMGRYQWGLFIVTGFGYFA